MGVFRLWWVIVGAGCRSRYTM